MERSRLGIVLGLTLTVGLISCAPRIIRMQPSEGTPGTLISLSMEYLVGWPRVEIAGRTMEWSELRLLGAKPTSEGIPGEELTWIEDKILQFRIPSLPPGDYTVVIHDDKGPPGDLLYSALESTAYIAFPPVWPFIFRSNQTQTSLKILPVAPTDGAAR
jgi:hypothetical protein